MLGGYCRPQALAAHVTDLLVWLFTTAGLRLYWHSAHVHQLPLTLTLLWSAKAACSVVLAVLQSSRVLHDKHVSLEVFFILHQYLITLFVYVLLNYSLWTSLTEQLDFACTDNLCHL